MGFFHKHDGKQPSKMNMDAGIRSDVTREVRKRMKSKRGLCEPLCQIIANKLAVRKLRDDHGK